MDARTELPEVPAAFRAMMEKRGMQPWTLEILGARKLTPHMRRVTAKVLGEGAFEPRPGQDLVLILPDDAGEPARRHYTIRSFDPARAELDIDVVLHGGRGLGERWALEAEQGRKTLAFGPRGRNTLRDGADWRLFVGDETGLPAILGMIEALPDGSMAHAILETADESDRQLVKSTADVTIDWISRGGAEAQASSPALIERLAAWTPPPGPGHVYLTGETSTIRRQRHDLLARGIVDKTRIFGEGYWRPGRLGGHDHLVEH
jgi:NADPH-dependent ferric siderophore reductase